MNYFSSVASHDRRAVRLAAELLLLLALGLAIAACTGDGSEATDAGSDDSDDSDQTVQTLDDAAPADAGPPVEDEMALLAPGLALDPNGLTILDPDATTTELLAFGDDQAAVIAGLEAVLGTADEIADGSEECPNGQATVATWDETLTVDFAADGRFLSWSLPPGSELTTIDNVGLGSPVSTLGDVVSIEDSTLGDEFEAGGFSGLAADAGADASIDQLWAGDICAFR